jgi:NTP pyrophosphatase (non-canonical NTP hydrolase)
LEFADYQQQAAKTAIYPRKVDDFSLAYLSLKLCGEANELRKAIGLENVVKEAGDVLWYAAVLAKEGDLTLEIPREGVRSIPAQKEGLISPPAEIAELIGKAYRDNDGRLNEQTQNAIERRLMHMLACVRGILDRRGASFDAMLQANLDKLADRAARNVLHGSGDNR